MATIAELNPQEGDFIKGAGGASKVVVVDGDLFWGGQFLSAYGGKCFSVVSRSETPTTTEDIEQRKRDQVKARQRRELDEKYM